MGFALKPNKSSRSYTELALFIKAFGKDPISTAMLQPGMEYFNTSYGFIAYKKIGSHCISLGGPVCAEKDTASMIKRFIQSHKKPILCYLPEEHTQFLETSPLKTSSIGIDRLVHQPSLSETNSPKIRSAIKKAAKADVRLVEFYSEKIDKKELTTIQDIQCSYLSKFSYKREIQFINTPLNFINYLDKRYFFIHDKHQIAPFGFIVLNPYYDNNKVIGYLLDIIRFKKTKLWGLWFTIVSLVNDILRLEKKELNLGFCPLYNISKKHSNSCLLSSQISLCASVFGKTQYFQRLHELKMEVPGYNLNRYIAHHSRNGLTALMAFVRATGFTFSDLVQQNKAYPHSQSISFDKAAQKRNTRGIEV